MTIVSDTCLDPYNGEEMADNLAGCDDGSHCVKYKTVQKLRDSGYINGWERGNWSDCSVVMACYNVN